MTAPLDLDSKIGKYASITFDDSTPLLEAGLESLALLRLAVEVASDDDAEIDATGMVDLRTVGDLKKWLTAISVGHSEQSGAPC